PAGLPPRAISRARSVRGGLRATVPGGGLRPRPRRHPPRPQARQCHGGSVRRSASHGLGPRQGPWGAARGAGRRGGGRGGRDGGGRPAGSEEAAAGTAGRSLREGDDLFTHAGSVLGTPAFMAPEQAAGAVPLIDRRSDVFGLGAVLAVVLTGLPPFVAATSEE